MCYIITLSSLFPGQSEKYHDQLFNHLTHLLFTLRLNRRKGTHLYLFNKLPMKGKRRVLYTFNIIYPTASSYTVNNTRPGSQQQLLSAHHNGHRYYIIIGKIRQL